MVSHCPEREILKLLLKCHFDIVKRTWTSMVEEMATCLQNNIFVNSTLSNNGAF